MIRVSPAALNLDPPLYLRDADDAHLAFFDDQQSNSLESETFAAAIIDCSDAEQSEIVIVVCEFLERGGVFDLLISY